jgi:hypothetical protein
MVIVISIMEWLYTNEIALLSAISSYTRRYIINNIMKRLSLVNVRRLLHDLSDGEQQFIARLPFIRTLHLSSNSLGQDVVNTTTNTNPLHTKDTSSNDELKWLQPFTHLLTTHYKHLQTLHVSSHYDWGHLEHQYLRGSAKQRQRLQPLWLSFHDALQSCTGLQSVLWSINGTEHSIGALSRLMTHMMTNNHWPHLTRASFMASIHLAELIGTYSCGSFSTGMDVS